MPCPTWKCVTTDISGGVAILSKVKKPDKFESHNSLKLRFTNIQALHSNFDRCEFFIEANSHDILVLNETNLDESIYSGNYSLRSYLPLIWKDSTTHMHGLAVYVKVELPFAIENTSDPYSCFQQTLLCSFPYFFFVYRSPSLYLCTFFDTISSDIDETVSSVNPSANKSLFGDLNVHHKGCLTYSTRTNRLVNSLAILLSQITYFRWLTFLLRSLVVTLTILLF